jgi:flagellin-like protein
MNLRITTKSRKAISPVLATVILIAITLIAAIAIAGFVFGLFGSFTSSAQVSAQVLTCTAGPAASTAHNNECNVRLTNTGTSNVAVTGCSVRIGGTNTLGNPVPAGTVPASGSLTILCTQAAATAGQTVGSQAIGSWSLSNGASVPFSGVWS